MDLCGDIYALDSVVGGPLRCSSEDPPANSKHPLLSAILGAPPADGLMRRRLALQSACVISFLFPLLTRFSRLGLR